MRWWGWWGWGWWWWLFLTVMLVEWSGRGCRDVWLERRKSVQLCAVAILPQRGLVRPLVAAGANSAGSPLRLRQRQRHLQRHRLRWCHGAPLTQNWAGLSQTHPVQDGKTRGNPHPVHGNRRRNSHAHGSYRVGLGRVTGSGHRIACVRSDRDGSGRFGS